MIPVTDSFAIDEQELEFEFIRSGGPGGQNVNKVSTACRLRFSVVQSSLPEDVKSRLARLAGKRMNQDGVLSLLANEKRTQEGNRQAAIERLVELLARAWVRPRTRRATRATYGSQQRRLESKKRRSETRRGRSGQYECE